ncbi:MAG: RecQ family ATP-dependent DNA helicase [Ignavibacteriota bacterium]|jgi:RecQ family ATP-dependent DNA helicase|nr:MAG: RecQ family ATP-dependent DNA helicase [Chlorobiota bacterium]MBE7476984.1 RecQ family ATP-dependent DNA helicase [Ignavibacteriales bacterium]MBL1121766.1 RecQ family ATP-dependent DNA helicase [Ignavibacteriota bacterium]MCC7093826.1 RecQ family ATP-dependent DNA helicase [Ignavibacteriaceae bacterium]MCE7857389.1 RecQ family ATP-dependent DNA helicase [Ignavibacteria bacterium CHB3]MEB2295639.1 RecQ family ATP-dependent DNA helicase [Ignavibacteria bacterium]
MIEKLECGYITSYIKDLLPEIDNYSHYKNKDIFRSLSAFELETLSSYPPTNNLSEKERQLVYVLDNLLSRGFPTFCSINLERDLSRIIRNDFNIQESAAQGAIKFSDSITNNQYKAKWIKSITDSLILFDQKFDPNKVFEEIEKKYNSENNITVSQEEKIFYCQILPNLIGLNISQLFEPQRKIETMLPANEAQNYFGQRVDFAIETVDIKVIIEIDGLQHFQDQVQMNLDNQRRNSLRNNGWKVIEITSREINEGLNEQNINELRNTIIDSDYLECLNQNETISFSSLSDRLIHIPLLVARFQKVLLWALKKGYLNFHQESWNLCFIEEDVSYAKFAVEDTKVWLSNFCSLYNVPLPDIQYRTEKTLEDFNPNSNNEILFYISLKKKWAIKEKQNIREKVNYLAFVVTSRFYFDNNFKVNSITPFPYELNESKEKNLLFLLQSIFRKEDYWEGQIEVLKRSLSLKPVIGLLPTGAGKSLTYQLSALLQPGVTLVVDPLRSLMFDQADNMNNYLIDNISFINSELTSEERVQVVNEMSNGKYNLVFIAPERFQDNNFRNSLIQMTVSFSIPYLVIDEAHCVSEWGHDFRTSYLNLAKTAKKYCKYQNYEPTVLALTGTASYSVLTDVQREIGIDEEEAKIYPSTFNRDELQFDIYSTPSTNKKDILFGLLQNTIPQVLNTNENELFQPDGNNTKSGLVFVPWTNNVFGSQVRDDLQNRLNIQVGFFSGSVPKYFQPNLHRFQREIEWNKEKRRIQKDFKNNEFAVLVSTKAFGMGIDKPNVRYTVHFGIPASLEAFYQEAGRAGRDRNNSYCIIIFSDDNSTIADQFLDINLSAQDLRILKQQGQWPQFGQEGDIHRMLFFHMNAFQGVDIEISNLHNLLTNSIYPVYNNLQLGQTHQIIIPRNDNLDKSIYRLSILGIVSDYTIDWNANQYSVTLNRLSDEECLTNLKTYLSRYKTPDYIRTAQTQIVNANGTNMLERCLGYIVRFAYNEIEKKRRTALKTILEVSRSSSQMPPNSRNNYIREQLLAYLEKSIFTDLLLEIVQSDDHTKWWEVLEQVTDIDLARQLLGGCRRTMESYPEYSGLYILSAFSRLSIPNYEIEFVIQDFITGINFLRQQYEFETQENIIANIIDIYQRKIGQINEEFGNLFLELISSRKIARLIYPSLPNQSKMILLSILLKNTINYNKHYIGN